MFHNGRLKQASYNAGRGFGLRAVAGDPRVRQVTVSLAGERQADEIECASAPGEGARLTC